MGSFGRELHINFLEKLVFAYCDFRVFRSHFVSVGDIHQPERDVASDASAVSVFVEFNFNGDAAQEPVCDKIVAVVVGELVEGY